MLPSRLVPFYLLHSSDRRRLHAEYAANWAPSADGMDRDELIAAVAEAVDARNGWKRILQRCM
jgi:hypothetical protein